MADEQDLWVVHSGNKTVKSGKNKKPSLLISTMDEMAVAGQGPIILETDDEKVLKKASEYAAQKGYPLVSSTPEQNLKITEFQRPIFGEDIEEGSLGPSLSKQQELQTNPAEKQRIPLKDIPTTPADKLIIAGPDVLPEGTRSEIQVLYYPTSNGDGEWSVNRNFVRSEQGKDTFRLPVEHREAKTLQEAQSLADVMKQKPAPVKEILVESCRKAYGEDDPRTKFIADIADYQANHLKKDEQAVEKTVTPDRSLKIADKEASKKYHDYNTILDKTLDKLPEGFETVIEVQASVVRDGVLMNTIDKMDGDKFNHWEAVRMIRQTDLSQPAISDGNPPQVIVERHPFSDDEYAANKAMDMHKEPITVERLRNVIDPELDTENAEHPRNALLKKLIAEREKSVEFDKTTKIDDPLADINAIVEQNKKQKNPFDDEVNRKKPIGIQPVAFPEIHPALDLTKRFGVATSKDYGNRLVVTRMGMMALTPPQFRKRDELIADTLLKARERFGEPVRVTAGKSLDGGRGFENAVIKAAIAQGIPLEMASDRGVEAYQLALKNEKQRLLTKEMGRMEPSMQKERGVSRGLAR